MMRIQIFGTIARKMWPEESGKSTQTNKNQGKNKAFSSHPTTPRDVTFQNMKIYSRIAMLAPQPLTQVLKYTDKITTKECFKRQL